MITRPSLKSPSNNLRARLVTLGALLTTSALALSGCSTAAPVSSTSSDHTYSIGVIQIAQSAFLDSLEKGFEQAVTKGVPNKKFKFDVKNANGDQSLIASIARDLASSNDDAFVVLGTPAVIALAQQISDKPIFAIAMGDPVGAGVAKSLDKPGKNVTGSVDYIDPDKILEKILLVNQSVKTVGTIYDPSNQNMQIWASALKKSAKTRGLTVVESTVANTGEIAASARSVVDRSDVVLIGPDPIVASGADAIGSPALAARVPLYFSGGTVDKAGILASIGPSYDELGAFAADAAIKVIGGGANPADVPFGQSKSLNFSINQTTAEKLGLSFPKVISDTAKFVK